ncbi:MAG: cytochrome c oxidase assembly protein [Pseudomonadota bacterium]
MPVSAIIGCAVLGIAWLGPLPGLVEHSFAAHMLLHMTVVGIGVPLVALGVVQRYRPALPAWLGMGASLLDLVVIWGWHAPALHHASRTLPAALVAEQASFAAVSLALWVAALSGAALPGALALFVTALHMIMLGTLIALSPRALYPGHGGDAASVLADQQTGGLLMLGMGCVIYLGAALARTAVVLRRTPRP